jgi:hypothetical protein
MLKFFFNFSVQVEFSNSSLAHLRTNYFIHLLIYSLTHLLIYSFTHLPIQ